MKKLVKPFLLTALFTTSVAAITPFLVSCVSNNASEPTYDEEKKEVNISSSLLNLSNDENLFNFYNYLLTYKNNQNDLVSKNYIEKIKTQLIDLYSNIVIKNEKLSGYTVTFDFTSPIINDWNVVIPTILTPPANLSKITENIKTQIKFPQIKEEKLNELIENNSYECSATSYFPNKTLEQIKDLSSVDIMNNLAGVLPANSELWSQNGLPFDSKIERDEAQEKTILKILVFTPNKGIGTLNLFINDSEVVSPEPSLIVKNFIGDKEYMNWSSISNEQMTPLDEINFTNVSLSENPTLLNSYKTAINDKNLVSEINTYSQQENYLANFNIDLNFFIKSYLSDLNKTWNDPSFLLSKVFVGKQSELTENNKLNAKIAIQVNNTTLGTKKIKLPIVNVERSINAESNLIILLEWKDADISPYLTQQNSSNTSAYLSVAFTNLSLKAYEISNKQTLADSQIEPLIEASFATPTNIYPISYQLKSIVTNVGSGYDILDSETKVVESYNNLTQQDLQNLKLDEVNSTYLNTLEIVKSVQEIMLKIAENPTIYSFLQDINSEMYNLIFTLTNDRAVSSIISDVFSTKKISEYLHANIDNIIVLLKSLAESNPAAASQLTYIIDILQVISNTNPTLEQKKEWVKSIIGLYPTLEKLIPGISWIMPLLKSIMTSISENDPPIVELLFSNADFIFQFLQLESTKPHIDTNTQNIILSVAKYLDALANFAKNQKVVTTDTSSINADPDKYKSIKVLDILVYEMTLTKDETNSSLFTLIADVLDLISPSSASVSQALRLIGSQLGSTIKLPRTLTDYSVATFQNDVNTFLGRPVSLKAYKVVSGTEGQVKLEDQFAKIIKSTLLSVKVGANADSMDLHSMLSNNVNVNIETNSFNFDKQNKTVLQDLKIKYTFKEDVDLDLMPLLVLVDNLIVNDSKQLNLNLSPLFTSTIKNKSTNKNLDSRATTTTTVAPSDAIYLNASINLGSVLNIKFNDYLTSLLPVNLAIEKDINYLVTQYVANNSVLSPTISSDGSINWQYNYLTKNTINYENILTSSKTNKKPSSNYYTQTYFGSRYRNVYLIMTVPSIIKLLFGMNNTWTSYSSISTNLTNPTKIENYNSSLFIPTSTVKLLTSGAEFEQYLSDFINNNGTWATSAIDSSKKEFVLTDEQKKSFDLNKYFAFGDAFKNPFINYEWEITSKQSKVITDKYEYWFVLKFTSPTLYSYTDTTTNNVVSSLVDQVAFYVSSASAPKPIVPNTPTTRTINR